MIDPARCKTGRFHIRLRDVAGRLGAEEVWVIARIKTSNHRVGLNISNGEYWAFSYHTGGGKEETLVNRITLKDGAVLTVEVGSETSDTMSTTIIDGVVVANAQTAPRDPAFRQRFGHIWARSHNPNPERFLDQRISLVRDFSITTTNANSNRWEAPFNLGINDRFMTGDFACQPDDVLLLVSAAGERSRVYLGQLPWKRSIREQPDGGLRVEFSYIGPIQATADMLIDQQARSDAGAALGAVFQESPPAWAKSLILNLRKSYDFNVSLPYAAVKTRATVNNPGIDGEIYWITQDTPVMNFAANRPSLIKALRIESAGGSPRTETESGFIKLARDRNSAHGIFLLETGLKPMAIAYTSEDAFAKFIVPEYLLNYLNRNGLDLASIDTIRFDAPNTFWTPGLVFKSDISTASEGNYRLYFMSDFSQISAFVDLVMTEEAAKEGAR